MYIFQCVGKKKDFTSAGVFRPFLVSTTVFIKDSSLGIRFYVPARETGANRIQTLDVSIKSQAHYHWATSSPLNVLGCQLLLIMSRIIILILIGYQFHLHVLIMFSYLIPFHKQINMKYITYMYQQSIIRKDLA